MKKETRGRNKLPKSAKKANFPLRLKGELIDRINKKTKGKNRSEAVESVLNENF